VPTYTYECACGRALDVRHSIHEEPEFECDNCGGPMERVIAAPAVQFKGSGFYSTDKAKSSSNTPKNN